MYDDNSRIVPQHTSRKRPRSNDEDNSTFMPCSKKILEADDRIIFPETSSSSLNSASKNQYQNYLGENVTATSIQKSIVGTSISPAVPHYSPELSYNENPFYYHINGVLHEAHMQRLHRLSNGDI